MVFIWGVSVGNYQFFPYDQIKFLKKKILPANNKVKRQLGNQQLLTQHKLINGKADIVMLGDSLTQAGLWSEYFEGQRVFNRGLNGEGIEDILNRIDSIIEIQPKKLFILVGINDFISGSSVEKAIENYLKIIKKLKQAKIEVIIQSTISCNKLYSRCSKISEKILSFNQQLQFLATSQNIPYINLNTYLIDQNGQLKMEYTDDGVHLLGNAYQIWVSEIKKILQK